MTTKNTYTAWIHWHDTKADVTTREQAEDICKRLYLELEGEDDASMGMWLVNIDDLTELKLQDMGLFERRTMDGETITIELS